MAGSLSVASTAVSSAKVAVVDSADAGRSAIYESIILAVGHCLVTRPHLVGRVLDTYLCGSYFTESRLHLHYKDLSVNVV
jgi:hypothetical protein